MLRRYEALMLAVPEITQDEIKNIESKIDNLVRKSKGTTISFERWGKYRLAYPVKKNDYGVYLLMRFESPSEGNELIKDIDSVFKIKLNNVVMRSMITHLGLDESMAYQRPKSLEEGNSTESSSFLKDKKVEGLISAVKSSGKKEEAAPKKEAKQEETVEKTEETQVEVEKESQDTESAE